MTDEDGTITAFASTMMIFEEEQKELENIVNPGLDLNLFPEVYDLTFDGVEDLPGSETSEAQSLTYQDFKTDLKDLFEKYNLTQAIL